MRCPECGSDDVEFEDFGVNMFDNREIKCYICNACGEDFFEDAYDK